MKEEYTEMYIWLHSKGLNGSPHGNLNSWCVFILNSSWCDLSVDVIYPANETSSGKKTKFREHHELNSSSLNYI